MTTQIAKLEQELQDLGKARKIGDISVNEYSSFYYSISQQIRKLKGA